MKTQQQAEREEQQRIKNLVLNYDLRESEDPDGDTHLTPITPNANIHDSTHSGHEKPSSFYPNRSDKSGRERNGQRVRRLQLSDVDWYEKSQQDKQRIEQNTPDSKSLRAGDSHGGDRCALDRVDESGMNKRHTSAKSRSRQPAKPSRRGRGRGKW